MESEALFRKFATLFRFKASLKEQTKRLAFDSSFSFLQAKLSSFLDAKHLSERENTLFESALFALARSRICLLSLSETSTGDLEKEYKENIELSKALFLQARNDVLFLSRKAIDIRESEFQAALV